MRRHLQCRGSTYKSSVRGTAILGDVNVHSQRWLHFSTGESPEGNCLRDAAERMGCRQLVQGPTRRIHLLDVVLSDMPNAKTTVIAAVADHAAVLATFHMEVP